MAEPSGRWKGSPGIGPDAFGLFVRRAREAARQALYLLRHLGASANLPFVFPLVDVEVDRVRLSHDPSWDPSRADLVAEHLTDGGVLSNSGLWPVAGMLMNNRLAVVLKQRGVLLVIVECSKLYGKRLAVVQFDLTPVADRNVHTTWSLDEHWLEVVRREFRKSWAEKSGALTKAWKALVGGGVPPETDLSRPPVD